MEKIYNPKDIEQPLYEYWEKQGYFKPHGNKKKPSYCIMIPPPNLTGCLHMGHAFQQTIMDILIRYQRMRGKNTLWQVGTDHAGIAMQMVVERKIATEEGKNRYDYGRENFIEKIRQWKTQSSKRITHQMRRLGYSVDWDNELFTMDDKISIAVKEAFVRLYKDNLIYREKGLVNWDPKLRTAISDLEVDNRELKGFIWYLRYPLADGARTADGLDYLIVATTRPETILGDTGVAVNPQDPRYRDLIGLFIILPLVGRRIPIIGDEFSDMKKGTGCVKITPAHDFNDYEVGKRHALPMINIFTVDAHIRQEGEVFNSKNNEIVSCEIPKKFRGLERFSARKEIVAECDRQGFLVDIKNHTLIIPYGDRSDVVIEPMLTNQWYIRTQPLAKRAIKAVESGEIQFVQKQYENMYFSWMHNIHDWCISRQLWWGHRIPAWYDAHGQVYVGHNDLEVRKQYKLDNEVLLHQDDDVLDTWFSSGLWTFSTLGWPENTTYLRTFHPTNVIVSGFDIIFFWIARMIMLTMHFIKDNNGKPQVPFKKVYITGLIRDEKGKKMSKSNGNIIDPLDMIDGISLPDLLKKRVSDIIPQQLVDKIRQCTEKQFPKGIEPHGTDALRFTLAALASTGRCINWDIKRLKGYRNFCNKLWNASRFILMNVKNYNFKENEEVRLLSDRWIFAKFNQTVQSFREALDNYRFDSAASILYEFTWNQFCNWYLELTKPLMNKEKNTQIDGTYYTLITILESLLRLAHPMIPFITETIWKKISCLIGKSNTIMLQPFPYYDATLVDVNAITDLEWIKQIIVAVRTVRADINISPSKPLSVILRYSSSDVVRRVEENLKFILTLAKLDSITLVQKKDDIPVSISQFIDGAQLFIPMSGLVNKDIELARLTKKLILIREEINSITAKLNYKDFICRAPEKVVYKEREKLEHYKKYHMKLLEQRAIIVNL